MSWDAFKICYVCEEEVCPICGCCNNPKCSNNSCPELIKEI